MQLDARTLLAVFLVCAISGVGGAWLGSTLGVAKAIEMLPKDGTTMGAATPTHNVAVADIEQQIRAIRERLEFIGSELKASAANARNPVSRGDSGAVDANVSQPELTEMGQVLAGQIRELAALLRAAGLPGVGLNELDRPQEQPQETFPDPQTESFDATIKIVRLRSCQEILDSYGMPDDVGAGGQEMHWDYRLQGGYTLRLRFVDGLVVGHQVFAP